MRLARATSFSMSFALVLPFLLIAPVRAADDDAPKDKRCWVLEKIDNIADQTTDGQDGWRKSHNVVHNADGSITSTRTDPGTNNSGSTWQVWPEKGKAVYKQKDGKGTGEVNWTVWPQMMCDGDDVTLSVNASAQGENSIVAGTYNTPANWFNFKYIDPKSKDPMQGVWAKQGTNSGTTTLKHTPYNDQGFEVMFAVNDGGYDLVVHYHYRLLKPGEKHPPKEDPPGKCIKTFGKSWPSTNWGAMAFTLEGDKATGTYTDRDKTFGPGTIDATVTGNVLEGTWMDAKGKGTIKLTLSDDGCRFDGMHKVDGGPEKPIDGHAHPPKEDDPPIPPKVDPGAIDLTGYWKSETGFIHYVRQIGDKVYWTVDALPKSRNILMGTITGDTLTATWIDLPGGAIETGTGTLVIKIDSNDHLTKISSDPAYDAKTWTRVAKPTDVIDGPPPEIPLIPPEPLVPPIAGGNPWETPRGQACIERWTAEAAKKLNAYDGGEKFNNLKPWGIDPKYGTLTNKTVTSPQKPDNFAEFKNNKYAYIWANYQTDPEGKWSRPEWNKAEVPSMTAFVTACQAE